jgi:hypothetical protein
MSSRQYFSYILYIHEIIQCGGKGMCREELEIKIEFHDEPKINSILVWNKIACIHKWT